MRSKVTDYVSSLVLEKHNNGTYLIGTKSNYNRLNIDEEVEIFPLQFGKVP